MDGVYDFVAYTRNTSLKKVEESIDQLPEIMDKYRDAAIRKAVNPFRLAVINFMYNRTMKKIDKYRTSNKRVSGLRKLYVSAIRSYFIFVLVSI